MSTVMRPSRKLPGLCSPIAEIVHHELPGSWQLLCCERMGMLPLANQQQNPWAQDHSVVGALSQSVARLQKMAHFHILGALLSTHLLYFILVYFTIFLWWRWHLQEIFGIFLIFLASFSNSCIFQVILVSDACYVHYLFCALALDCSPCSHLMLLSRSLRS